MRETNKIRPTRSRGFTLLELAVALVIFSFVVLGMCRIFNTSRNSEAVGLDLSEAQQNARIALSTLEKDLRLAGFGIPTYVQVPILVASEYRITFVKDLNGNNALDPGETVTYFLDPNTADFVAASTPNPRDMVLRRTVSDALNPGADPISGCGHVVASGLTQQTDDDGTPDVPMFVYFDENGNSLVNLGADDPYDAAYGHTISDAASLGKPAGGANEVRVMAIRIAVVTETEAKDQFLDDYQRVSLLTRVAPRNLPLNLR
jgi:prepilin-type N-terminal cleavage/methylation domain-containing protein